jgi:hypothetical protein
MRSFVSFRLAAQISMASAVLCLFPLFREQWPAFALLVGLTLLAGLGAGGCKNAASRLAWGLLPLPSLILSGSDWAVRAALLALTAYTALFAALGRFSTEIWRFRRSVGAYFVLFLVLLVVSGLGGAVGTHLRLLSAAALVLALLALRALLLGAGPSAGWQAGSVGLFFLPIAGGALAGTALWMAGPVLKYAVYGLSAVWAGLVSIMNAAFSRLTGLFRIGEDFFEETPVELPPPETAVEAAPESAVMPSAQVRLPEVQIPWGSLLALLAVAAVILLAVWLLRRDAPAGKQEEPESVLVEDVVPAEARTRRSRRKKSADRSCRGEIRLLYREYLAFLREQNIRPNKSATTAEISAAAASALGGSDERLRDIYRKCRYSAGPVTQEDVASAREALNAILRAGDETPA